MERCWPSALLHLPSDAWSVRYPRLAIAAAARPGSTMDPVSLARLPVEVSALLSHNHMWVTVGSWPGDACANLTCVRAGQAYTAGTMLWAPPSEVNPVTDFVLLTPGTGSPPARAADRWRRRPVPAGMCTGTMAEAAAIAHPPGGGYSCYLPGGVAPGLLRQVLDAVTGRLSRIGGPAAVILAVPAEGTVPPTCAPGAPVGAGAAPAYEKGAVTTSSGGVQAAPAMPCGKGTALPPRLVHSSTAVAAVVQRTGSAVAAAFCAH